MAIEMIREIDDPRVRWYRLIRERVLRRDTGRFIADGRKVVKRMIDAGIAVDSVLADEQAAPIAASWVDADAPIYTASTDLMERIVGFKVHTGMLALGQRPPAPSLDDLMARARRPATLVVASHIKEAVNLGSLIRTCGALGVDGLVIGPECCDPWYRRAVRVSMGAVFTMPVVRCDDLPRALRELREQHGVRALATMLHEEATPLEKVDHVGPVALVLGHEVHGLDAATAAACDGAATIPMARGTDSLNVAVAAGIFAHHLLRVARREETGEPG